MAEHFYRLKDLYGDKMKLIYTDTDSLIIEVKMPEKEAIKVLKDSDPDEKIYEFEDSREKKVPGRLAKCEKTTEYAPIRTYNKIRSKNHIVVLEKAYHY
jgi:Mg/Co/Ni transporter MgtE